MRRLKKIMIPILIFCTIVSMLADKKSASAAGHTLQGKNGVIFYWSAAGGSNVYDYKGNRHYSEAGLKRVTANILRAKEAVEKRGAKFVLLMVPNKEVIYSNLMPKSIKRKSTYNRYDQLYDYLEANTDIDVCYPKKELLKQRDKYLLYYPTDSHWNRMGQYIGTQELLDVTDGKKSSIRGKKFKPYAKFWGNLSSTRSSDHYKLVTKVKKEEKSNKKLLLVGDSFCQCMAPIAGKFYKKVRWYRYYNFHMNMVKKDEVVVWECVEWYQDRLSMVNLAAR